MALIVSSKITAKLAAKHNVTVDEVKEALADRPDYALIDDREEHASDPPTEWFIAYTCAGRRLKVVYVYRNGDFYLRTADLPNQQEIDLFESQADA